MRNASIDYSRLDLANLIDFDHPLALGLQHAVIAIPGVGGGRLIDCISQANATVSGAAYWTRRGHQPGLATPSGTNIGLGTKAKQLSSNFTVFVGGAIGTIPAGTAQWVLSTDGFQYIATGSTNINCSCRFVGNVTTTITLTSTAKSNEVGCGQVTYNGATLQGYWNGRPGTSAAQTLAPQASVRSIGSNFSETFFNVFLQYNRVVDFQSLYYQWKNGFQVKDSMLRYLSKKTYSLGPQFKPYWHRRQQQIIGGGLK